MNCMGITKKGEPCKKLATNGTNMCSIHQVKSNNNLEQKQEIKDITVEQKSEIKDITVEQIFQSLEKYIDYYDHRKELPDIRAPNFPEHISENICKFLVNKYENLNCTNSKDKGDLLFIFNDKVMRIEVKAFISDGPSTFGPEEYWDILYFLDCKDFKNRNFKLYKINLASNSDKFLNLQITKNKRFGDKSKIKGYRPRFNFYKVIEQFGNDCTLIYDGNLSILLPNYKSDNFDKWLADYEKYKSYFSEESQNTLNQILKNHKS